jgi:hypothetical protein
MKKLVKILALLTIAAALFMGCSNSSSGSSNNDNGTPSDSGADSGKGTASNAIELSDGNWTVKIKMTTTQVKDAVTYVTLHATVSGKNVNYTSGTIDTKQDMSIYSNLTDDQLEDVIADMNAAAAATGTGLTYSYDKTTKTLFMCMPMTQAQLKQYSDMSDLSKLPSDVKVTSNAAKTQYSFTVTGEGTTIEYTITKD